MSETTIMRNLSQDKQQAGRDSYPLSPKYHQNLLGCLGGMGGNALILDKYRWILLGAELTLETALANPYFHLPQIQFYCTYLLTSLFIYLLVMP